MTASPPGTVLVVAPLREELRGLRTRLQDARRLASAGVPAWTGRIAGVAVHLAIVGDGAPRAAAGLAAVMGALDEPVRALLVVGVAGGLSPTLTACDVMAPVALGTPEATAPPPDSEWRGRLPAALRRRGTLVSVERVVTGREGKRALAARMGPSTLLVDLESAALAELAAAQGIPFLVLRCVSDTVDESLPRFLAGCLRPDGSISRARVVGALLRRPRRWRALRAIERRMRACSDALADAAVTALSSL